MVHDKETHDKCFVNKLIIKLYYVGTLYKYFIVSKPDGLSHMRLSKPRFDDKTTINVFRKELPCLKMVMRDSTYKHGCDTKGCSHVSTNGQCLTWAIGDGNRRLRSVTCARYPLGRSPQRCWNTN